MFSAFSIVSLFCNQIIYTEYEHALIWSKGSKASCPAARRPDRTELNFPFPDEKCVCMLCKKMTRDLFRTMSLASRRKCPRNVVQMKGEMAAFFGSNSVVISSHCKGSKIILVKVLTEVCSLESIGFWNWQKIAVAWSDSVLLTLRSLVCMWKTCRKGG